MRAWISLMDISYVSYMRSGEQGNDILYSTQYTVLVSDYRYYTVAHEVCTVDGIYC